MKTNHPADAANNALIDKAVRFDVSLFLGAGAYARTTVATKSEAFVAARQLAAQNPTCARHPLIYAVNAQGRSAVVPFNISIEEPSAASGLKFQNDRSNAKKRLGNFESRFPTIAFRIESDNTDKGFYIVAALTPETANQAQVLSRQGVLVEAPTAPADHPREAAAKAKTSAKKTAPAKAAKANKAVAANDKPISKRAAMMAAAEAGKLPEPPDFSAATHARFRNKLNEIVKLAKAGDIAGLNAYQINPTSSSPKAMDKYRNLAVIALKARAAKKAAA